MRVAVIVNGQGGTASQSSADDLHRRLTGACKAAGLKAEIDLVEPGQLADAFEEAGKRDELDAIVAGGGDGTISLAAAAAVRHQRVLGVLPLGTLNHLARDAGLPQGLDQAVAVIAAGHAKPIDAAEVNGRIFVNNSSVGLYPLMVREREAQQRSLGRGKRFAMLIASIRALRHFRRHRLAITVAGGEAPIETPLLFVGNNVYETGLFQLGQRTSLDRGELCIYAALARTRLQLISLALRGLVGDVDQQRDFVSVTGIKEARIDTPRQALTVAADGETFSAELPLHYRILPGALRLLMPEPAAER